jgi:NADP-dependent 3-hydroxy acid dehydrogenase YdfG
MQVVTVLREKVAVVTGAGSGIGRAIALSLGEQGAMLCLVGRNLEKLEMVASIARPNSPRVRCYQADLMVDKDILELAMRVERDFGELDILIHSAGFISLSPMESASLEDFDRHYRVNARGPYALTQALLPMLRSSRGQIVFINSSVTVMSAKAKLGQYAATKHALKAIADSLREEVNADGLRVLSVYPGRTATPMQAAVHKMEDRQYQPERLMQPEDVATMVVSALSLPRTTEVTEIMIRPFIKA